MKIDFACKLGKADDLISQDFNMPRRKKTIADYDAMISAVKAKRDEYLERRSARIAKLVIASGLCDLNVDDKTLKRTLDTLRERFQKTEPHQRSNENA